MTGLRNKLWKSPWKSTVLSMYENCRSFLSPIIPAYPQFTGAMSNAKKICLTSAYVGFPQAFRPLIIIVVKKKNIIYLVNTIRSIS
jgi:hypothetical protein